jgi:hypothetical protein
MRAQFEDEKGAEIQLAPDTFTYFGSLPDVVIGEGEIELELKEADFQG